MDERLYKLAEDVGVTLKARALKLATAESCTGGWVGEAITAVAGSSDWYERGYITYTDQSKREMLGVKTQTLKKFGAVSEPAVTEMAAGALAHSHAQAAIAVSGIAGPTGGTPAKPVGTVCIAWALGKGTPRAQTFHFAGNREAVRRQSVERALAGLLDMLRGG